jgi:hypothetical protein
VHELELPAGFMAHVDGLISAAEHDDVERVRALLSSLVPTYDPLASQGKGDCG